MKALEEPQEKSYGLSYLPYFTSEFQTLIESGTEKIEPFRNEEVSQYTVYFKVRGEEVSSEFDCCGNEECIKQAEAAIRRQYGKGTHVEECWYYNDGDHERIEICSQCGKPLNEWLTWCNEELEYLEENKPWDAKFFKNEAFLIHCIFQSSPTLDYNISRYAEIQSGDILKKALERREQFFQRIGELAQSIIDTDFESESQSQ
jgi:hypothetical protein